MKVVLFCITVTSAGLAWACGPDFPNQLLTSPDRALFTAPAAEFTREIAALVTAPAKKLPFVFGDSTEQTTLKADLDDLDAALKRRKASAAERKRLAEAVTALRAAMSAGRAAPLPNGLPAEFKEYLTGALAWHAGKADEARAAWLRVLVLKEKDRHFRSTWATFMLGKASMGDRAQATRWFKDTRDLAAKGFADSLGLALTSLGWQANVELAHDRFGAAAALYLEQVGHEDPTALISLQRVGSVLLQRDAAVVQAAAREPLLQRVVTAWLVSRTYVTLGSSGVQPNPLVETWLKAVEDAGVSDLPGADRLAWLAYRYGWLAAAERWLAKAPQDAPIALWLRAKLLMREGKLGEAATTLSKVVAAFPQNEVWTYEYFDWASYGLDGYGISPHRKALAELGVLQLSRREFTQSLDALLRSEFWEDAAYVAERVVTTDELKTYVDTRWPKMPADPSEGGQPTIEDQAARNIRTLLGRRLAREGHHADAARYLPKERRAHVDQLARHLAAARDQKLSAEARALELWRAARITREAGLEILGTELAPDFAVYDGSFEVDDVSMIRAKPSEKWTIAPAPDELTRAEKTRATPYKRWHYRYIAAGLAWQAAAALPDNSDAAAGILCQAGKWLAARDPKEADRFYKALVKRTPQTAVGSAANVARWFSGDCKAPK